MKRRLINTGKIIIGVGLVVLLLRSDRLELHRLLEVRERWPLFLFAQLLFLFSIIITVFRWRLLLHAFGVQARFGDAVRLGWIGLFFNQCLPGSTGGDVVKGFYIARETPNRRIEAVITVILDRVIGLTGMMVLGGFALLLNYRQLAADPVLEKLGWILAVGVVVVFVVGGLLAWEGLWQQEWIRNRVRRIPGKTLIGQLARTLWTVPRKRKILLVTLGISVLNHCVIVGIHLVLATALLGSMPSIRDYFFLVPVGQLAFALPISPGGLGIGEWAYEALFAQMGQSSGAEIAALMRLTWLLWGLLGLYFYLRGRKDLEKAARDARRGEIPIPPGSAEPGVGEGPPSEPSLSTTGEETRHRL